MKVNELTDIVDELTKSKNSSIGSIRTSALIVASEIDDIPDGESYEKHAPRILEEIKNRRPKIESSALAVIDQALRKLLHSAPAPIVKINPPQRGYINLPHASLRYTLHAPKTAEEFDAMLCSIYGNELLIKVPHGKQSYLYTLRSVTQKELHANKQRQFCNYTFGNPIAHIDGIMGDADKVPPLLSELSNVSPSSFFLVAKPRVPFYKNLEFQSTRIYVDKNMLIIAKVK